MRCLFRICLVIPIIIIIIISTLTSTLTFAEVQQRYQYFGINATLTQTEDDVLKVNPNGAKANEGFVFTVDCAPHEKLVFEIELKGSTTVYLKIQETNARGTFIRETVSKPYRLTEEWQVAKLLTTLSGNTKQVDFLVLTVDQTTLPFYFQNINVERIKSIQ